MNGKRMNTIVPVLIGLFVVGLLAALGVLSVSIDNNHRHQAMTIGFDEALNAPGDLARERYVNFTRGVVIYLASPERNQVAIVSGPITFDGISGQPMGKTVPVVLGAMDYGRLLLGDIISVSCGKLESNQEDGVYFYFVDAREARLDIVGRTDVDSSCLAELASTIDTSLVDQRLVRHSAFID
jgi:hypothetical protein